MNSTPILTVAVSATGQLEVNFHRRDEPLNAAGLGMILAATTDCFARILASCHGEKKVNIDQVMAEVRDSYINELSEMPAPASLEIIRGDQQ